MHGDAVENSSHDSSVLCTCTMTSWNYEKQWYLDLTNFPHWTLNTWLFLIMDHFSNSDLTHSDRVALWCPLPMLSPCARECYREELWGPGTMNATDDTLLLSHVSSSGTTLRGAPLKHTLPTRRLTKQYPPYNDSLHLTALQSHACVRGAGWDNSHTMHQKKGCLRDMYTLIKLVNSGTDWHPRALCPTQIHFVKLSWHSIIRYADLQYIVTIFFLIFLFCFTLQHEQVQWYNWKVGELHQGNKTKKLKGKISEES